MAVWLSNDPTGIKELNEGIDVHTGNQKAFSLPTRLIAKKYLFRTIYRGSGWAFAHDPEFSHVSTDPDYWDQINKRFYKKYYGLDRWHNELANLVASRQPIVSPLGREWLITPIVTEKGEKLHWPTFTNYPVQGTGNDLLAIARISLFNRMKALSLNSLLVSTVHDSIVVDSPRNEVKIVGQLMLDVFNDLPKNIKKLFGVVLPITFPGEVKVGPNLKNLVKFEEFLCQ